MRQVSDLACPFCAKESSAEILIQNELAFALPDGFPVSPGHALVLPRRHLADYFELTAEEKAALWELVDRVREQLLGGGGPEAGEIRSGEADERGAPRPLPSGFNLGVNVGQAAGQTVFHVHVHVIPRYDGDSQDPRGGVRWILPERARYWGRE